ncbi:MAG: neutral zinc metallopeptidase [Candidatus Eisenbacteria bacterium]
MRWTSGRRSTNVEDRRGRGTGLAIGGGITTLIALAVALLFGADPRALLEQVTTSETSQGEYQASPQEQQLADFVSVVLGSTEDVWKQLFQESGMSYQDPILVLFTDQVQSACGIAGAAVGPFYCSEDHRLYIDLGFYDELRERFGAPGDFAQAYVIAHEVGHHVQNLLGTLNEVHNAQQQARSEREANALSVRLELQADYLAGVWAHYAQQEGLLEPGDIEEALNAASAIGDDRLQREMQGRIVPDSFTHGTSAQRVEWFRRGLQSGDPGGGDTFDAPDL